MNGRRTRSSKSRTLRSVSRERDKCKIQNTVENLLEQRGNICLQGKEYKKKSRIQHKADLNERKEAQSIRDHEQFVEKNITRSSVLKTQLDNLADYTDSSDEEHGSTIDSHQSNVESEQADVENDQRDVVDMENNHNIKETLCSKSDEKTRLNESKFRNFPNVKLSKTGGDNKWAVVEAQENLETAGYVFDKKGEQKKHEVANLKVELNSWLSDMDKDEDERALNETLREREQEDLVKVSLPFKELYRENIDILPEYAYDLRLVHPVFLSNSQNFLEQCVESITSGSFCGDKCMCKLKISTKVVWNLLHLAASVSKVKFVDFIVSVFYSSRRSLVMGDYIQKHNIAYKIDEVVKHYEETIQEWMISKSFHMCPVDIAAEYNRIEIVNIFLEFFPVRKRVASALTRDRIRANFLSRLAFHSNLGSIKPEYLTEFIECAKLKNIQIAISGAAYTGDLKTLQLLSDKQNVAKVLDQENYSWRGVCPRFIVPGKKQADGTYLSNNGMKQPVHLLAEHGHFETFDGLSEEQKRITDCYGFTALVSMLEFPDDEVQSQLKLFRSVKREDLFLFISQIIIKKRRALLHNVLKMTLSNPDNFKSIRHCTDVYEEYGLPDYVPLPMETALSRLGDVSVVEEISKCYNSQENFTNKMKEEDALRCIQSIQDKAFRCTDHIRLAVILVMLQFVYSRPQSLIKVMRVYLDQGMNDKVAEHILSKYSKVTNQKKYLPTGWEKALDDARKVVVTWNGSVEDEKYPKTIQLAQPFTIPAAKITKNINSILTEGNRARNERVRRTRSEERVKNGLKKAIEKFEKLDL